jgi:Ca2+-binding EF-hand superfamily protein
MIERMDKDKDGQISFDELCQSLATFSIFLTTQERQAVMKKLDFNRDGQISKDEIYHAL